MLEEAFKLLYSLSYFLGSLQHFSTGLTCPSKMELDIKVYSRVVSRPAVFLKKFGNIRKVSELYGIGVSA